MLDNEPDADQTTTAAAETPAPRRRRAASRPAGPPTARPSGEAPPQGLEPAVSQQPDPVSDPIADRLEALVSEAAPEPELAPEPEPEARPTRRRTRKTAEPVEVPAAAESAETVDEQPVKPARRRTRKAAAPAPAAEPEAVEPEVVEPQVVEPEAEEPVVAEVPETDQAEAELVEGEAAPEPGPEPAEPTAAEETDDEETEAEEPVADETEADEAEDADSAGDGSRRRRRRRGGRRRRRTGEGEGAESADATESGDESESSDATAAPEPDAEPADAGQAADDESVEEGEGTRRRRRRRRRRGEDAGSAPDDPTDTVVRVREPRRSSRSADDQVTGISGSTRMEAKRQRRREGREAGRRRAPILSEAEFLARRESVTRKMIIRQRVDLTQIAVLEDDILVEHYVDRESATSLIGNVYVGRVQNVLPSMEAAFVDIGRGRNAVLYAGEVDWDSFGAQGQNRKVEKVLKSGQTVLVQVTKDPVGAKGARLTNHVSIPGRYIVYAPSGHLSGISRKLPENERKRLKDILSGLVGEASVIVRTAAEGASEEELVRDVNRLQAQWSDIEAKVAKGQAPQLLYGEPDLTVRIVRDLFTEDFSELIVAGSGGADDAYDAIDGYVQHVAPHLADRLKRYAPEDGGNADVFARYRIDEQIAKALERKVFLPSGGSLVIDRTEAMTVIDVNTGKFTGSGGNLEATVTSNNLEAAEEIVRQLRLRDLGGIIVIDFIDMVLPANRELLLRRLVECLGRDRTRHQVAEVTSLGLVQMTRKRIGTGLLEAFSSECPTCHGRGYEIHDEPVETQRQADGGAREQRGSRRGGGSSNEDHASSRSGRSRGGRGRRGSGDAGGSDAEQPHVENAHNENGQAGIAAVAAGSRLGADAPADAPAEAGSGPAVDPPVEAGSSPAEADS